jgi:hypothetical protein
VAGSGTINDPFDGGTRLGSAVSLDFAFDPREVIAVFAGEVASHDVGVTILNVTGPSAVSYNKTFPAGDIQEIGAGGKTLKIQLPGSPSAPPGPGVVTSGLNITANGKVARLYWPVIRIPNDSVNDLGLYSLARISGATDLLFNGDFVVVALDDDYCWCLLTTLPNSAPSAACVCAKVNHRYDQIVQAAPPNTVIHLGPGTFETRGMSSLYFSSYTADLVHVGCLVRNGQKLQGSGIDVTVLKLVHAIDPLSRNDSVGTLFSWVRSGLRLQGTN